MRTDRVALTAAGLLTVVLTSACVPSSASTPTASSPPAAGSALATLDTLRVAPEDTGAHYNRKDWNHWIDQPSFGKGCNTRDMILAQQGKNTSGPVTRNPTTCAPLAGHGNTWTSLYDNVVVTDPAGLDVDHIVPLEQMTRSGTRDWTAAQRQAYANDPQVLVAVTARANRQKGSQDPARWLPAQHRCEYVSLWVATKARYQVTVDQAEHDAAASVLRRCGTS